MHQDRLLLPTLRLYNRLLPLPTQHKAAHMQALQRPNFQNQGETRMRRRTGGDELGTQEFILVLDQRLVDLDTTRHRMLHALYTPHSLLLLRPPDSQGSKASTMLRLRLRYLGVSQVRCKLMLRHVRLLITRQWSTRPIEVTTNERAFHGKSTV